MIEKIQKLWVKTFIFCQILQRVKVREFFTVLVLVKRYWGLKNVFLSPPSRFALPLFSLFFHPKTFMKQKPPTYKPVKKTDKCPLYSGKDPKTNGNAQNNWPKPEFRTFECRTILQQFTCVLFVRGFFKKIPEGGSTRHIYVNSYSMYINFIFLIYWV